VFDRPAGYHPKTDPIVRVQARRLRSKLETYHAASGRPGGLQIVLPKGGYIPEFSIAPRLSIEGPPKPEIASKPSSVGRKIAVLSTIATVAIIAVLLLTRRSVVKPVESRLITAYPGYQNTPTFSPDGQTIAFSWGGPESGDPNIYLQRLDADAPSHLTNSSSHDRQPAWLPGGEHVSFLRDDGPDRFAVIVLPVVGAGERRVATLSADSTTPPRVEWSRDGKKLYASERIAPTLSRGSSKST
jgi:hypothetical protein